MIKESVIERMQGPFSYDNNGVVDVTFRRCMMYDKILLASDGSDGSMHAATQVAEIAKRFGISGIDEKASRKK